MKMLLILIALGIVVCMPTADLSAKTFCFLGGGGADGSYFILSGGKVDEKPFSGRWEVPGVCSAPAWAAIVTDDAGIYYITVNIPHGDPSDICRSAWFYASGPTIQNMSGEYDQYQNGDFDNGFTLTELDCQE